MSTRLILGFSESVLLSRLGSDPSEDGTGVYLRLFYGLFNSNRVLLRGFRGSDKFRCLMCRSV